MKNRLLCALLFVCAFGILCSCIDPIQEDRETYPQKRDPDAMRQFVIDISNYAKGLDDDFLIIPQNGVELFFEEDEDGNPINSADAIIEPYLNAVDGVGVEELFFIDSRHQMSSISDNGEPVLTQLNRLQDKKTDLTVMVSDFINANDLTGETQYNESVTKNTNNGFLAFPREGNYHYDRIPINRSPYNMNSSNITSSNWSTAAKNYLYHISYGTQTAADKEKILADIKATNYDVVLIDAFVTADNYKDGDAWTKDQITELKKKANGGTRLVLAYINVGAAEMYRYYWKTAWKKNYPWWINREYGPDYPDEYWVVFWADAWKNIIYGNPTSYIRKIVDAGFDGAYLDNVEGYNIISLP